MGQISVTVTVSHPSERSRHADVKLIVDTGATLSWVPREIVERLGVPLLRRRPYLLADGRTIERDTAGAVVKLNGTEANVTIAVAETGDGHLLGMTALETLGLAVDPVNLRLIPQTLLAM
jgi:clan AA aspartic protease